MTLTIAVVALVVSLIAVTAAAVALVTVARWSEYLATSVPTSIHAGRPQTADHRTSTP